VGKGGRGGQLERGRLSELAGQRLAGGVGAMQGYGREMGLTLCLLCPLSATGPPRSTAAETSVKDDGVRIFVALFDYDPVSMSPNPDAAEEELPFKEGQILKVRAHLSERLLLCMDLSDVPGTA